MEIIPSTVPGAGLSHDCRTRAGQRFAVFVEHTGGRHLYIHGPDTPDDDGTPTQRIDLDPDEADQLADLLHQRSVADRLTQLERRVSELVRSPAYRRFDA